MFTVLSICLYLEFCVSLWLAESRTVCWFSVSLWLADSLTVCWFSVLFDWLIHLLCVGSLFLFDWLIHLFSVVLCCFYSCLIWVSDSMFGVRCALPCVSLCLSLYVSCLLFEFLLVLWLLLTDFVFAVHSQPHNWRDLHQATCVFGVLCLGVFSLSVSSQWLC
jgi:hypothetical protein